MKSKAPPIPLMLGELPDPVVETRVMAEPDEASAFRAKPSPRTPDRLPLAARIAYPVSVLLSLGWAAAATAFAAYYKSEAWRFDFTPTQTLLLAIVVILPVILIALGAYTLRQSGELILETRRARAPNYMVI